MQDGAHTAGWADLPRKSFPAYIVYFVIAFVADWMPALGERNVLQYSMLAIPVAALGCAFAGIGNGVVGLSVTEHAHYLTQILPGWVLGGIAVMVCAVFATKYLTAPVRR